MTFSEIQQLLQWARAHGVANIKARDSGVDVTFYPDKAPPDLVPPATDLRRKLDMDLFGVSLEKD